MTMRHSSALSLALTLSFCAPAVYAGSAQISGTTGTTAFSGIGGVDRTLTKAASANDAIFAVEVAERSDDPCFLEARYRDVATGVEEASRRFAECNDSNNNEGTTSSRSILVLPAGTFVTGVRICLNSDRDKMKGIQIIGRYSGCILGLGQYVAPAPCSYVFTMNGMDYRVCDPDAPTYVELDCDEPAATVSNYLERTNCQGDNDGPDSDWESTVSCADGKVATGIRLSTTAGGGGRTMINGVGLECTALTVGN
jgi:hypothetical protein